MRVAFLSFRGGENTGCIETRFLLRKKLANHRKDQFDDQRHDAVPESLPTKGPL